MGAKKLQGSSLPVCLCYEIGFFLASRHVSFCWPVCLCHVVVVVYSAVAAAVCLAVSPLSPRRLLVFLMGCLRKGFNVCRKAHFSLEKEMKQDRAEYVEDQTFSLMVCWVWIVEPFFQGIILNILKEYFKLLMQLNLYIQSYSFSILVSAFIVCIISSKEKQVFLRPKVYSFSKYHNLVRIYVIYFSYFCTKTYDAL